MKKLLVACFLIILATSLFAQTPSDRRKQQQDESTQSLTNSQKRELKKMEDANNKIFGDDDPGFKVTVAPDKWKNESAVILDQNVQYEYYTESHTYKCDEYFRSRVLLLDKSAVDEFATQTFAPDQEVGFRVIKKDGTVKKISTLDAVELKEGVSYNMFGHTSSLYAVGRKKLAIPDLEPGDILDYYYKHTDYRDEYGNGYKSTSEVFEPVIFTLPEKHPILKQSVVFYVEKGYYVNFCPTNGAPDLKVTDMGDKKTKEFSLEDNNREKQSDEFWKYPFRSEPTVKFQVVYATNGAKDDLAYFLGDPGVPTTKVPHDLLQGVADQLAMEKNMTASTLADETISYMKSEHKNLKDPIKYMEYAYYYMRFYLFVQKKREEDNNSLYGGSHFEATDHINDIIFIKAMGLIARDNNIPYELVFAVPRNIGTLDNMVLSAEMSWAIKIKGPHDVFMYPFNTFTNPDEPDAEMEGVDAYSIVPSNSSKKVVMNKTSIPVAPTANNTYSYKMDVTLNPAIDGSISIARNATVTGLAKHTYYPEVLIDDIYQNQELKKYDQKTDLDNITHIKNEKERTTEMTRWKNALDEDFRKRLESMKGIVKDDYDVDSYDEFNMVNAGIEMDSTNLVFNDKFKIKSLSKKVGPNYVLEVGKLLGSQTELKDKDSARINDIYLFIPYEKDYECDINIPAGYKVDGIDALNMNVSNKTGGFTSTAKMNGNKLVITTKKYYASNYQPKSNWPDMYKFLRASYDFSQKKVLLKKA